MTHIYAIQEDTGERKCVAIKCDECGKEVKPGEEYMNSDWTKRGLYYGLGDGRDTSWDYCGQCTYDMLGR